MKTYWLVAIVGLAGCPGKVLMKQEPLPGGHAFVAYGSDDRVSPAETEWQAEARAVGAVIPPGYLRSEGRWFVLRSQERLRDAIAREYRFPPCGGFRFADEYVLPWAPRSCSAVVISERIVLTARHCVLDPATGTAALGTANDPLSIVFGFDHSGPLRTTERHRVTDVVSEGRAGDADDDWAFVRVDPPIDPSRVVPFPVAPLLQREQVSAIGHPNHLSLLVSPGFGEPHPSDEGDPTKNAHPRMLLADVDVGGGSSGGPVFSRFGHALVGIVRLGDGNNPPLTTPPGGCVREKKCEQGLKCPGALIVSAERFQQELDRFRGVRTREP